MTNGAAIPRDPSPAPPGAQALALLGMVAALLCLIAERVLPRLRADGSTGAALVQVHAAMALLAAAAWREIERADAPGAPSGPSLALEEAAALLHDAMRALLACLARRARRPVPGSSLRRAEGGSLVPLSAPRRSPAPCGGRARDGPPNPSP